MLQAIPFRVFGGVGEAIVGAEVDDFLASGEQLGDGRGARSVWQTAEDRVGPIGNLCRSERFSRLRLSRPARTGWT